MIFADHKQDALDEAHSSHPQIGDYWSEMYSPIARVLMVDGTFVVVQRLAGYAGKKASLSDPKPHVMTRQRFKRWLSYNTIPGTWAQVSPKLLPPRVSSPDVKTGDA